MTRCDMQASGAIELYFYDELGTDERAAVERHLPHCAECTHVLDELRVIRAALSARPDVSAPESGEWSAFMRRLDGAIGKASPAHTVLTFAHRRSFVAYAAMAALLALVTLSVAVALRSRHAQPGQTSVSADRPVRLKPGTADTTSRLKPQTSDIETAAFERISEEHFERSKLVVLGLATKDAADPRPADWAYERDLAASLLNDTRMYRFAAEDRGLTNIAGVMRDLEMVLLQTSLTDERDPSALRQIQRVIQRRDLLEKMDAVASPAADRATGTKGI